MLMLENTDTDTTYDVFSLKCGLKAVKKEEKTKTSKTGQLLQLLTGLFLEIDRIKQRQRKREKGRNRERERE